MQRWRHEPGPLPGHLLEAFGDRVAKRLGLHFPEAKRDDLARAAHALAAESGGIDAQAFLEKFLPAPWGPPELATLARHLTNGETWLFREPALFDALRQRLLPELRRRGSKRLRIWSAGCSSGEEAWSVAISLAEALPDLDDWDLHILATDINPAALEKARRGAYRPWSFRACPVALRDAWFHPVDVGVLEVDARLRSLVSFRPHNLAEDGFPPGDWPASDLIICRNVLMYFRPDLASRAADSLGGCLIDGGWLGMGAAEASAPSSARLQPLGLPEVLLFRKSPDFAGGLAATPAPEPREPPVMQASLAHDLANRGQLDAALVCCARALCRDRLDLAATHLQASIFMEQGRLPEAVAAFRRTLYIDPEHCMAQVSLGNLLARQGRRREASRHLNNALSLIAGLAPDAVLAGSGGVLVGGLRTSIEVQLAGLEASRV